MTWMVQAQNFAKRENYPDAVARAKLVRDEVASALSVETDVRRRSQVEQYLGSVETELADLREQYRRWSQAIAARRQATIDNVDEEFARPLPLPVD